MRIRALQTKEEEHKKKLAQYEGQREQLLQQLKEQFDIDSLDEAKDKLEKMRRSIQKRTENILTLVEKLERVVDGTD